MTANGTLADSQLVNFYGVRLAPQAAADAGHMINAAALAGFVIRPLIVKDAAAGYRSTQVQAAMRYAQAHGHAAEYDLLPSPPAPPLAPVGQSRHGQGRACDWVWQTPGAFAWLLAHGHEYNWRFWDLGRDKPHMEHDSIAHDVVTWTEPGLAPASTHETPLPTPTPEDESMTPRTVTLDGGKTFIIQFPDGRSKPLIDYRTGKPMNSDTVKALNIYLRYGDAYYPHGVPGAAVMDPAVFYQFSQAIDPTGSTLPTKPAS